MEQDLAKQIQERLAELPEDVRKAVQSAELEKKIQDIGKKNNLHIDQAADLEEEVLLVMLGFADPLELRREISSRLRIDETQANKIAGDITQEIFLPIRESMKKFMEGRAKEEPVVSAPPPAPAPVPKPITTPLPPPKPTPPPAPKSAPVVPPPLPKPAPAVPPTQTAAPAGQSPLGGAKPPAMPQADKMLAEKTISKPTPPPYKADPYREPPE